MDRRLGEVLCPNDDTRVGDASGNGAKDVGLWIAATLGSRSSHSSTGGGGGGNGD